MNCSSLIDNSSIPVYGVLWGCTIEQYKPLVILYFILLPFYIYVNKVNRRRDEKMVIFPITNHYYNMLKLTLPIWTCFCVSVYFFHRGHKNRISTYTLILTSYALYLFNQVFRISIIALSFERFLVYFFPTTEKNIILVNSYIIKRIKYIYLGLFIKDIICIVLHAVTFFDDSHPYYLIWSVFFITIFYTMHILLFLSALLYIPILISIRKLSHLASSQLNNPQRYIFWQTMILFVFKSMSFSMVVLQMQDIEDIFLNVISESILESATIPLLIVISYLGCNKRNVTVLLSSFKLKQFLRTILGLKNTVVEPQQYVASIHSTV
ncbi:Serpentine Receptor, class Z [Caenorhabditis elegans]|uniref:Serpentine Receptor, class Z n=1 Tax=Caenorhabditis elegans TaxID=6239 RepID=Q688C1_CAEEL|nr:Serpentine Receptor, class Z [Caenorhabditis elegans]CCD64913.1 Serpentine Receptor, class Z [Caenorhabditis elegans]|eukprot:NP_001021965.1 Serpentine Receptor, class Z [Caenorhabditis elegans]